MKHAHDRKLSVVYFSDIVGYTRLMGQDEDHAFDLMTENLAIHKTVLEKYNGRIIKELGDGILATFDTAPEAMMASLEIQKTWSSNSDLNLRIGLHCGEVIFDHGDVFGDAVNIAARIQSVGVPSSVVFSEQVLKLLTAEHEFTTVKLGLVSLKNVQREIELYALTNQPLRIPRRNEILENIKHQDSSRWKYILGVAAVFILAAFFIYSAFYTGSTWDKDKSVAVLPFENLSKSEQQDFFAAGLTSDVITQISKINSLKVISEETIREFRNEIPSLSVVGKTLNVSTVLRGTIQFEGEQIKINVELVDVAENKNIWAESFNKESADIFLVQSEIAREIARALDATLSVEEQNQISKAQTSSFSAYEMYLKGRDLYYKYDSLSNIQAAEIFRKAIKTDPNYAMAYTGLADTYAQMDYFGNGENMLDSSIAASSKALEIDPYLAEGYNSLGSANYYKGRNDLAQIAFEKALVLNPNFSSAMGNLATIYFTKGELVKAYQLQIKSTELNPKNYIPFQIAGWIQMILENHQASEELLTASLEIQKEPMTYEKLAFGLINQGKMDEAKKIYSAIFENNEDPGFIEFESAGLIAFYAGEPDLARESMEQALSLKEGFESDPYFFTPIYLSWLYLQSGEVAKANDLLEDAIQVSQESLDQGFTDYNIALNLALAYQIKGEADLVITNLELAKQYGWRDVFLVEKNPMFKSIQSNPAFSALIEKLKTENNELKQEIEVKEQANSNISLTSN